jgi:hypothetical protein
VAQDGAKPGVFRRGGPASIAVAETARMAPFRDRHW